MFVVSKIKHGGSRFPLQMHNQWILRGSQCCPDRRLASRSATRATLEVQPIPGAK